MAKTVDPKETTRAMAYALWMKAPQSHGDFLQDIECHQPETNVQKGQEIPYADAVLYREGGCQNT